MRKCSFCIQRIDRGEKPACVAKCATGALEYFADGRRAGGAAAYGEHERLRMIYELEEKPGNYALPNPVPRDTVISSQLWNWLMGLIPGGLLLAWMWKKVEEREAEHE